MPTYRNSTNADITVGSIRFPARSTIEVSSYIEGTLPAGLSWISNLPNFNPVILAQKYSAKAGANLSTISVGASDTKGYFITFYVESGEFQIRMNGPMVMVYPSSVAVTPPILITEGQNWGRKYVSRVVESIDIHCVIIGTIYVNIYKL
jgi:hypothetical protein